MASNFKASSTEPVLRDMITGLLGFKNHKTGEDVPLATGMGGASSPVTTLTAVATTLTTAQAGTLLCDPTLGNQTNTLPTLATAYANGFGMIFSPQKIGVSANTVTFKGNGAELIAGSNTITITSAMMLQATPIGWVILSNA